MTNVKLPHLSVFIFVLIASCLLAQNPTATPGSAPDATKWTDQQKAAMAEHVRQDFLHAWGGYKQYAWGHDELRPLTKSYRDWYGTSLLMTPVDALDTMLLLGLKQEANEDREPRSPARIAH